MTVAPHSERCKRRGSLLRSELQPGTIRRFDPSGPTTTIIVPFGPLGLAGTRSTGGDCGNGPHAYRPASATNRFAFHVALIVYTTPIVLRRGDSCERQLLAASAAFFAGIPLVSLYHWWINDFQAQGRSVFPMLALSAIPLMKASRRFRTRVVAALLSDAFALSDSSMLSVALRKIAKVLGPKTLSHRQAGERHVARRVDRVLLFLLEDLRRSRAAMAQR